MPAGLAVGTRFGIDRVEGGDCVSQRNRRYAMQASFVNPSTVGQALSFWMAPVTYNWTNDAKTAVTYRVRADKRGQMCPPKEVQRQGESVRNRGSKILGVVEEYTFTMVTWWYFGCSRAIPSEAQALESLLVGAKVEDCPNSAQISLPLRQYLSIHHLPRSVSAPKILLLSTAHMDKLCFENNHEQTLCRKAHSSCLPGTDVWQSGRGVVLVFKNGVVDSHCVQEVMNTTIVEAGLNESSGILVRPTECPNGTVFGNSVYGGECVSCAPQGVVSAVQLLIHFSDCIYPPSNLSVCLNNSTDAALDSCLSCILLLLQGDAGMAHV